MRSGTEGKRIQFRRLVLAGQVDERIEGEWISFPRLQSFSSIPTAVAGSRPQTCSLLCSKSSQRLAEKQYWWMVSKSSNSSRPTTQTCKTSLPIQNTPASVPMTGHFIHARCTANVPTFYAFALTTASSSRPRSSTGLLSYDRSSSNMLTPSRSSQASLTSSITIVSYMGVPPLQDLGNCSASSPTLIRLMKSSPFSLM